MDTEVPIQNINMCMLWLLAGLVSYFKYIWIYAICSLPKNTATCLSPVNVHHLREQLYHPTRFLRTTWSHNWPCSSLLCHFSELKFCAWLIFWPSLRILSFIKSFLCSIVSPTLKNPNIIYSINVIYIIVSNVIVSIIVIVIKIFIIIVIIVIIIIIYSINVIYIIVSNVIVSIIVITIIIVIITISIVIIIIIIIIVIIIIIIIMIIVIIIVMNLTIIILIKSLSLKSPSSFSSLSIRHPPVQKLYALFMSIYFCYSLGSITGAFS